MPVSQRLPQQGRKAHALPRRHLPILIVLSQGPPWTTLPHPSTLSGCDGHRIQTPCPNGRTVLREFKTMCPGERDPALVVHSCPVWWIRGNDQKKANNKARMKIPGRSINHYSVGCWIEGKNQGLSCFVVSIKNFIHKSYTKDKAKDLPRAHVLFRVAKVKT